MGQLYAVALVFQYMNLPGVASGFGRVNDRFKQTMQSIDETDWLGWAHRPVVLGPDGNDAEWTWLQVWNWWIAEFLTQKQTKMMQWMRDTLAALEESLASDMTEEARAAERVVQAKKQPGGMFSTGTVFTAYGGILAGA